MDEKTEAIFRLAFEECLQVGRLEALHVRLRAEMDAIHRVVQAARWFESLRSTHHLRPESPVTEAVLNAAYEALIKELKDTEKHERKWDLLEYVLDGKITLRPP